MIETQALIGGLVGFMVGVLVGYLIRGIACKMTKNDESTIIMLIVCFMWAISVAVDMLSAEYETPMLVHAIMGGIVGYFFKFRIEGTTNAK